MPRIGLSALAAGIAGLLDIAHAVGQPVCKPALALQEVNFSEMQPPTLERTWSAAVSVDATPCAAHSEGRFEIVFTRLKEIGLELEFRERFAWRPPAVNVKVDFWADEAVEVKRYWIDNISPCPCRETGLAK
jgi:hypothetical protein